MHTRDRGPVPVGGRGSARHRPTVYRGRTTGGVPRGVRCGVVQLAPRRLSRRRGAGNRRPSSSRSGVRTTRPPAIESALRRRNGEGSGSPARASHESVLSARRCRHTPRLVGHRGRRAGGGRHARAGRPAKPPGPTGVLEVRESTRHQVVVSDLPHGARRLAAVPASGARRAVTSLVRLVGREHHPPPLGETGQLGTRRRDQRRGIRLVGEFGEHVEALPHRIAEYLPENFVHLALTVAFPPVRRLRSVRPGVGRAGRLTAAPSLRAVRRGPPRRRPHTP